MRTLQNSKEQSTREVEHSTDILARKIGDFEMFDLVGGCPAAWSGMKRGTYLGYNEVDDVTEAEVLLLEFEAVDGTRVVAKPKSQFVTYNSQATVLEEIVRNGHAYVNGEESVIMAPTKEVARRLDGGEYEISYAEGIRGPFTALRQWFELKVGTRDEMYYDRQESDYINCRTLPSLGIEGFDTPVEQYLDLITSVQNGPVNGRVIDADNPNELEIEIRGEVYTVHFEGRPTSDSHVPSKIAENMGLRVFENLEGESILVGSGRYHYKNTNYEFVGRNDANTLAFGIL